MSSWLSAMPGLLFVTLCYALLCAISPVGDCRKCKGWGFKIHVSRWSGRLKPGRACRRCDGLGHRLRTGRHLYNLVVRLHREGNR